MNPKDRYINNRRSKWFEIKNYTDQADEADVYIYDEIREFYGFSANDLVEALNSISASTIKVHLSSPGGDAFQGLTIMNALRKHPARVIVDVDGMAASAGSIIAMGGDEIVMGQSAMLMVHQPWTGTLGNAKDLRQTAEFLDKLGENLAQLYANRTDGDVDGWTTKMDAETWFNPQEAVEIGLADRVAEPVKTKKSSSDKQEDQNNDLILNNQHLLAEIKAALEDVKTDSATPSPEPKTIKKDSSYWDSLLSR